VESLPLLSIFIILFVVPPQGFRLGESFLPPPPPHPCRHPGGALVSSPLPPCPQSFAVDMIGLPYRLILR
jgi:hypothetical protein